MEQKVQETVRKEQATGQTTGKAEMLLRQLRRRFDLLPDDVETKVSLADSDQLNDWMDRLFSGEDMMEIFQPQHHLD
jgi:hypothetical protein